MSTKEAVGEVWEPKLRHQDQAVKQKVNFKNGREKALPASKIHPHVKDQQDTIQSNGPGIWVIQNFARTRNILSGEVSRGPFGLINQFSLVHLLSVRTDHFCSISVLSHAFAFLSRSCHSVVRFPSQRRSRSDFSATQ